MLERRVQLLEEKINIILEKVAPVMIKNMKYCGNPKWMTPNLVPKKRKNDEQK